MTNLCGELVLFPPKEVNNPLNRSLELLPTKGFLWFVYSNSRESKYFERNMLRVTFCPPYPPGFDFTGNNTKRRESTSGWSHTQPWQEKKKSNLISTFIFKYRNQMTRNSFLIWKNKLNKHLCFCFFFPDSGLIFFTQQSIFFHHILILLEN